MRLTHRDFLMKLMLVNDALDRQAIQRFGFNVDPKARYCLMKYAMKEGKMTWVECTDYMSTANIWHFLDGMFTLLVMEGKA